jgi:hypothetical protein
VFTLLVDGQVDGGPGVLEPPPVQNDG